MADAFAFSPVRASAADRQKLVHLARILS
jgi:hypothetical protein